MRIGLIRKDGIAIKRPCWNWRGYALWPAKPSAANFVTDSERNSMTEEKLHGVLEQMASLGQRPSEQVLLGLAAASGQTYDQVLQTFDALERQARLGSSDDAP